MAVLIKSVAHDKTTAEPFMVGVAPVANSIEDCQDARRQAGGWLVLGEIRGVNDAAHVPQCWILKIVRLEQAPEHLALALCLDSAQLRNDQEFVLVQLHRRREFLEGSIIGIKSYNHLAEVVAFCELCYTALRKENFSWPC